MQESKDKEFRTELVKITRVESIGLLGTIKVRSYRDEDIVIVRYTLTTLETEEMSKSWSFVTVEVKDGKLYYVKHVKCEEYIYHTLKKKWMIENAKKRHTKVQQTAENGN